MAGKVEFDTKQATKSPSLAKPQETVTITVGRGADSQTFKIHKDTLCHHSPFFATAFNGSFLEGKTQVMALDDVEGNAFGLLVAWLYTKTISDEDLAIEGQSEAKAPTPSSTVTTNLQESAEPKICKKHKFTAQIDFFSGSGPEPNKAMNALRLAKLWVLGQRFLIPDLQNSALAKMHSIIASPEGSHPQLKDIAEYAYSGECNELRMLVIEVLAFVDTQCPLEDFPKRILADITKCLRAYCCYRKWGDNYAIHRAEYFFVKGGTESTVINDQDRGWGPLSAVWVHPSSTSYW